MPCARNADHRDAPDYMRKTKAGMRSVRTVQAFHMLQPTMKGMAWHSFSRSLVHSAA